MLSEFFRNTIAGLLSPTTLIATLLVIGIVRRCRKILISTTILFFLLATAPLKTALYSLMEVPSGKIPDDYEYVVVLGGRIFPNSSHPVSSQITPSLLSRLSHGVKLTLMKEDSLLVLTGNGSGDVPEAVLMKQFALDMGVPEKRIILEDKSMNTSEHPLYLMDILKDKKFLIVTSAYHMRRALLNFEHHGLSGVPAPTDYMNKDSDGAGLNSLIPRGENLSAMDRFATELYSTAWTAIRMLFK